METWNILGVSNCCSVCLAYFQRLIYLFIYFLCLIRTNKALLEEMEQSQTKKTAFGNEILGKYESKVLTVELVSSFVITREPWCLHVQFRSGDTHWCQFTLVVLTYFVLSWTIFVTFVYMHWKISHLSWDIIGKFSYLFWNFPNEYLI